MTTRRITPAEYERRILAMREKDDIRWLQLWTGAYLKAFPSQAHSFMSKHGIEHNGAS